MTPCLDCMLRAALRQAAASRRNSANRQARRTGQPSASRPSAPRKRSLSATPRLTSRRPCNGRCLTG